MIATLRTRTERLRRDESGFTLIELLIVVIILGVLAGIVVFAVSGISDRGEESACKTEHRIVGTAIEAFYAENGNYPADDDFDALESGGFLQDAPPEYVTGFTVTGGDVDLAPGSGSC